MMKYLSANKKIARLLTLLTGCLFFLSLPLEAAKVVHVKGNAFQVSKTKVLELKKDTSVPFGSEVMTEEDALVVLRDGQGSFHYLSGSGQIKVFKDAIELIRGHLWVQSKAAVGKSSVVTANSEVFLGARGEGIISFDGRSGRSQLLVLLGKFDFANLSQPHKKVGVSEREFSFIDDKHEAGTPRNPTEVGSDSLKKVLAFFPGVRPLAPQFLEQRATPAPSIKPERSLASVKGEKIKEQVLEAPKKKKRPLPSKKVAKIKIFGSPFLTIPPLEPQVGDRFPAAIREIIPSNQGPTGAKGEKNLSPPPSIDLEAQRLLEQLRNAPDRQ